MNTSAIIPKAHKKSLDPYAEGRKRVNGSILNSNNVQHTPDIEEAQILVNSVKDQCSPNPFSERVTEDHEQMRNLVATIPQFLLKGHICFSCSIIHSIIKLQYFPRQWKSATIIYLSTPDKLSLDPINIFFFLRKVAN